MSGTLSSKLLGTVQPSIVVVTPAHNEAQYLPLAAKSLFEQTLQPAQWVIVDDNSDDGTFAAAKDLASGRQWITVVRRQEQPIRGDQSFLAFNYGLSNLPEDWGFLMKLDGDTKLPPNYFEKLLGKFIEDSSLGIASGINTGETGIESHPRGNNRIYRSECWKQIRFPSDGLGWDTLDEVSARLNGWETRVFSDIMVEHLRSRLLEPRYRFRQGQLSRYLGYYWWFVFGRSVKIMLSHGPNTAASYLLGYLNGGLGQSDHDVSDVIKLDQRRRILRALGLSKAIDIHTFVPYSPRLDDNDPTVTIAMPTLNRSQILPKSLKALLNAGYPKSRIRLVFVDGFSTDGSYDILQNFARDHGTEYKEIVLLQQRDNIPSARNTCVKNCGEVDFLIFLDSDVIVEPSFLARLIGLAKLGGITSIYYGGRESNRAKSSVGEVNDVGMGCTLLRRDVIAKVGLFDTTLPVGEDTDYCIRARKEGFKVLQDASVHLLHLDEGRYDAGQEIIRTFKHRRVYGKLFRLGVYRKRITVYTILDVCLLLSIFVSAWILVIPLFYFLGQFVRRRSLLLSAVVFINSLLMPPLTMVGFIERKLTIRRSVNH